MKKDFSLHIDTSCERGIVGLFSGDHPVIEEELPFGHQSSKNLMPTIEGIFEQTKLHVSELQFIGCGIGPGSYTGIRIGAMAAKTLSFASSTPLVGVCSLELFIPSRDGVFAAMMDARSGGVYVLLGEKKKGEVYYSGEPAVASNEEVLEMLPEGSFIVTPHSQPLKKRFSSDRFQFEERAPSISRLYLRSVEKFSKKEYNLNSELELLYLRE